MNNTPLPGRLYQAVSGFEDHLLAELKKTHSAFLHPSSPLIHVADLPPEPVFWFQNCWLEPFRLEFSSISEAASALRGIQRNWAACSHCLFRRSTLITSKLPPFGGKPRPFPFPLGDSGAGAWTLIDNNTIIASARCSSPFSGGVITFVEDKLGPPSRAYLKLWEALTLLRRRPAAGQRCLDAGASPGGWTWALSRLGAQVTAVDRSPLDDRVAAMNGVEFIRHDAFTLSPKEIGPIDWLFCDVACYPPRLLRWVEQWLASGLCRNFVCTIKMQGAAAGSRNGQDGMVDFDTPRRFAEIPGGQVVHLYHNKHELTWMYCK